MNYFLIVIFSGGTILSISLIAFLLEPAGLIPIIYIISLIALHIYLSIKVIKAYKEVAKEKKASQAGSFAKVEKRLFRAKLYFIAFWGYIILSTIYFYIWILPDLISFPPDLAGKAVAHFLDKFFGFLPAQK